MVEPALGISGALTALRDVRPQQGGAGDLGSAASDLSSAAQGLRSVQGNIAGQTMAIQQMSLAGAQQVQSMNVLMSQLNMSVGQLVGAISQMTQAMRMQGFQSTAAATSLPPSMPFIPPTPAFSAGGFAGGLARGVGDVLAGVGRAGVGAFTAGARGVGNLYGAAISPFFGATFQPPEVGAAFGSVGNAGMMRSLMLGSGIGTAFGRAPNQMVTGGELTRLAAERGAFKFGEIGLGATTGLASFGTMMLGGGIGSSVGSSLGGAAFGGLGRFAGGLAGGIAGGALIGGALMAPIQQTMDQVGMIRAGGELFGRNAFRFMGSEQIGGRAPNFRERSRFGSSMLNEGIEDLTFGQEDMQRIFGAAVGSDLMRGVNSAQQVRQRLRQTKDSIKAIGQTMSMTIEESAGLLGDLQAAGIDPSRAMRVLGGFNVAGLTRREAMSGQMAFSGQFAGTGLQGAGLMRLGAQSQQMAQTAIRMGALSPEQLAAVGGRAGAQQVMGNAVAQLMQGDFGTMAMFAGMPGGGIGSVRGGALGVMGQAGAAATPGRMAAFAANPQKFMRDAMNDPRAMNQLFAQISSAADTLRGGMPGVSKRDLMSLIMQGQGLNSVQADAALSILEKSPQAMRDQAIEMQGGLNNLVLSQRIENFSIFGRAGRAIQRLTGPAATGIAGTVAGMQDTVVNMATGVRDKILGIEHVNVQTRDVNMATMRALSGPPLDAKRKAVLGAKVDAKTQKAADNMVKYLSSSLGGADQMEETIAIRSSTDPEEKKALAHKLVQKLSGFRYSQASEEEKKAFELAASREAGVDISGILNSGAAAGLSKSEKQALADAKTDMMSIMGGGSGTAGGAVGGAAGAILGFLAPIPGGTAIGTAVGAALGAQKGILSGMSDEQITTLARNSGFQKLIKSQLTKNREIERIDADFKSGKITREEANRRRDAAVQKFTGAAADVKMDEIPADVRRELMGMSTENLAKLNAGMATFERLGGRQGSQLALETGFAAAKGAAGAAGLGDLASALAAGEGGMNEAVKRLHGLSETERIALAGQGQAGAALLAARGLKTGMTRDQVASQFGEEVASLMGETSELKTEDDVAALQKAVIAQAGGAPGTRVTGGGFTETQAQQQAEMASLLYQTTSQVKEIAEIVKSMQ